MQTRYVVTLAFPDGPMSEDERARQQEFLSDLENEGALLMAGPFADGGGMAILVAETLEEAKASYGRAPVVASGRATWDIREWRITRGTAA